MTLYKDIYDTIGSYANIVSLDKFMNDKEDIKYICDSCDCVFSEVCKSNIMIFEMIYYNNNTIYKFKDYYGKVSLLEYMNLTNIKVKKSKYTEILKIYCNNCCKKHNNSVKKLEYFNITDEPLHISKSHLNFIKLTENLFKKDYISKKLLIIKRYKYDLDNTTDELTINSLSIDKKQSLKMILTKPKFSKIKDMLYTEFSLDPDNEEIKEIL